MSKRHHPISCIIEYSWILYLITDWTYSHKKYDKDIFVFTNSNSYFGSIINPFASVQSLLKSYRETITWTTFHVTLCYFFTSKYFAWLAFSPEFASSTCSIEVNLSLSHFWLGNWRMLCLIFSSIAGFSCILWQKKYNELCKVLWKFETSLSKDGRLILQAFFQDQQISLERARFITSSLKDWWWRIDFAQFNKRKARKLLFFNS